MALPRLDRPGDFIAGRFVSPPRPEHELTIHSPADVADRVAVHPIEASHVDDAVEAARQAFPAWRRLSRARRVELLRAYQGRLSAHAEDIALTLAREVGKPLWEARGEVRAMRAKVDVSVTEGAALTAPCAVDTLPGEIRYRPHGVLAVIGPFNFPGHLPNGQIVPALLEGNTVVHKPSEKTPSTATWMARCFDEAGFPPGTVNVVQGEGAAAERLATHEGIDGVLFTGSAEVGKRIVMANAANVGRLIALELGGKNASIVHEDADLEHAARQIAFAGYVTAGQRCSATSRVIAVGRAAEPLAERLAELARGVRVGYPLDDGVFSGPMIRRGARDALLEAQQRGSQLGFETWVEGRPVQVAGHEGWYMSPALHRAPDPGAEVAGYTDQELFGPDLVLYAVEDFEQALAVADRTRYGLVASVFTQRRDILERAADGLRVGLLHWNRASAGASGRLPFGGVKDSGNHRPAGLHTALACAYPMGIYLEPPQPPAGSWPGFP